MSVTALPRTDAAPVRPYRPRSRYPAASVDFMNRLVRARVPFAAEIEGLTLRLAPGAVRSDDAPGILGAIAVGFVAEGDVRFDLRLPASILDRIARAIQPDLAALPGGPAGALLLELALAPLLEAAEATVGCAGLHVASVAPPAAARRGTLMLLVEGQLAGEAFPAQLDLGSAPIHRDLPARLDALLRLLESAPIQAAPVTALPASLAFRAGHTRLTLAQFRRLEPGDAVLPDVWHPSRGETLVTVGGTLAALATTDRHTSTLKVPFGPVATQDVPGNGDVEMAQDAAHEGATGMDGLSIVLAFELGRRSVAIGDLKAMGAGHVFDLGLDPAQPVDLMANGTRIGQGEIVEIGERIGVRVVRLFGQD